jgi:hypothetical protein
MSAARNLPRSTLTGAQREAALLRTNCSSRFAVPFDKDPNGINTEPVQDRDKTHRLKLASI